jgi:hypothetical protein
MTRDTDPYRQCELGCRHELGLGVRLTDLLGGDGPHPPGAFLTVLGRERNEPTPPEQREWPRRHTA